MIKTFKVIFLMLCLPLFSMEPFYWKYVDKISREQDNYFKQKYYLSPCMDGGGGIETVDEIGHGYAAPYSIDIEGARVLLVEVTNRFLIAINNQPKLRPYLKEYPFPVDRLKIKLSFLEKNCKNKQIQQIVYVSLIKGKIWYSYDTHTDDGFKPLHKETFAEANAIVASKREAQPLAK